MECAAALKDLRREGTEAYFKNIEYGRLFVNIEESLEVDVGLFQWRAVIVHV